MLSHLRDVQNSFACTVLRTVMQTVSSQVRFSTPEVYSQWLRSYFLILSDGLDHAYEHSSVFYNDNMYAHAHTLILCNECLLMNTHLSFNEENIYAYEHILILFNDDIFAYAQISILHNDSIYTHNVILYYENLYA
jgi:hypothetical protein